MKKFLCSLLLLSAIALPYQKTFCAFGLSPQQQAVLDAMKQARDLFAENDEKIDNNDQDEEPQGELCSICKERGALDRTLDCNHSFHAACINEWLGNQGGNQRCPVCRRAQTATGQAQDVAQRAGRFIPAKAKIAMGSLLAGFSAGLLTHTGWKNLKNLFSMLFDDNVHIASKLCNVFINNPLAGIANFAIHKPIRPHVVKSWSIAPTGLGGLLGTPGGLIALVSADHHTVRQQKLLIGALTLGGFIGGWKVAPKLHSATERGIKNILSRFKVTV